MFNTEKIRRVIYALEQKQTRLDSLCTALASLEHDSTSCFLQISTASRTVNVDVPTTVISPFFEAEIARLEKEIAAYPQQISPALLASEEPHA